MYKLKNRSVGHRYSMRTRSHPRPEIAQEKNDIETTCGGNMPTLGNTWDVFAIMVTSPYPPRVKKGHPISLERGQAKMHNICLTGKCPLVVCGKSTFDFRK